jgi:hypothetical protein
VNLRLLKLCFELLTMTCVFLDMYSLLSPLLLSPSISHLFFPADPSMLSASMYRVCMILYDSILASGHGIYGVFSCFFWMGSGNCF